MSEEAGLRILALEAENVKRLRAVEIRPDPQGGLVIIGGANAAGKQQPISEPVLTPAGWLPIGNLQVGHLVIGSSGKPVPVTAIHPQIERQTFRVTLADGGSVRCGPDHLWNVWTWKQSHRASPRRVKATMTTKDLIAAGLWRGSKQSRKWALPDLSAVCFQDLGSNLPIDPYALGVILGDGHIELTGYVTITSPDVEIIDRLKVRSAWRAVRGTVICLGTAEWSRPLSHLGLAGKLSHDKFIPPVYHMASIEDRRALLAGLLDTDGTASRNWAEFSTASEQLAQDVTDLARSLGHIVNTKCQTKKYTYKGEKKIGQPCFIVRIRNGSCPFLLSRKKSKWKPSMRGMVYRFIDSIEVVEDQDSVCIEVAAKDGLYVTKDFILTHNSSVLDAILYALGGEKAIPAVPIREGETHATISLDLGLPDGTVKFRVTRSITPKGNYLRIAGGEDAGMEARSPQKLLDRLLGALSFDPLAFTREKPAQQRAILLAAVGLQGQMDEIDAKRKEAFDERTDLGRELRSAEGHLKSLPPMPKDLPGKRPKVGELVEELEAGEQRNREYDIRESQLALATGDRQRAEAALEDAAAREEAAVKAFEACPKAADITPIRMAIQQAEAINKAFDVAEARAAAQGKITLLEKQVAEKGKAIEDCDGEKQTLLAEAKLPVEGLNCDEAGVTFDGLPFEQAASSAKLQVSAAIGMALNPTLRVMRIEDGSLLDAANLLALAEMAHCGDFQIWIERVGGDDAGAIVIDDGSVTGAEPQEAKPDA